MIFINNFFFNRFAFILSVVDKFRIINRVSVTKQIGHVSLLRVPYDRYKFIKTWLTCLRRISIPFLVLNAQVESRFLIDEFHWSSISFTHRQKYSITMFSRSTNIVGLECYPFHLHARRRNDLQLFEFFNDRPSHLIFDTK